MNSGSGFGNSLFGRRSQWWRDALVFGGSALTLALSGCLNVMQNPLRPSKTAVTIEDNLFNNQAPTIVIGAALRTQVNPEASIDVLGWHATTGWNTGGTEALPLPVSSPLPGSTGAERIRAFCTPSAGSDDKKLGCSCVFRTGTTEQAVVPLYYEADLVRCPIPEALRLSSFLLYLKRADTQQVSNALQVEMTPQIAVNDPLFYSKVTRYACRQAAFVSHMMDPTIIDPIQTESPANARTFLHYTTNFGRAMALFSELPFENQAYTQCPPHLDPAKVSQELQLYGKTSAPLTISDVQGRVPSGAEDHVNFRLAKSQVGPFNVRVIVSQAPGIAASSNALPQLGFAALPDSSGACPSTPPPAGMRWRKLWLFRSPGVDRLNYRVPKLLNFAMACRAHTANDDVVDTYPDASPVISRVGSVDYRPNQYFLNTDCGRNSGNGGSVSGNNADLVKIGTACDGTTTNSTDRLIRILFPTGEAPEGFENYHRCVSIDRMGTQMQDRCTTSQFSCAKNSARDLLGLCQGAGSSDLQSTFSTSSQVTTVRLAVSQQYLFLVTAPELHATDLQNWTLEQPGAAATPYQYRLVTDPLFGASVSYPFCVLQSEGGSS